MTPMPTQALEGPRAMLASDHARLDRLFSRLLAIFRSGDREAIQALWTSFDEGLTAHLDAEEQYVLPLFEQVDPREAEALREEHAGFRQTLADLGVGVDLHMVGTPMATKFVEALREHARREDALMYQWADRNVGDEGRASIAARLGLRSPRAKDKVPAPHHRGAP